MLFQLGLLGAKHIVVSELVDLVFEVHVAVQENERLSLDSANDLVVCDPADADVAIRGHVYYHKAELVLGIRVLLNQ